ncbi:MAG: DUF364 domain-containing protein [Ardenticatenaceae bacterium]|nr:DUF364 domain-containing protein [Ardenticatenaceae bacterium]
MKLLEDLLGVIADGETMSVTVGLHWTAVVVDVAGETRCGLASTVTEVRPHGEVDVPQAGRLAQMPAHELAALALCDNVTLRSVGVAAINALLPPQPEKWVERNAEHVIAAAGANKTVVLVGHFPFIARLQPQVGRLWVLEQNPGPGEHPAAAAAQLIPQADVVAITSMTLLNGTLDGLLAQCRPGARVLLLGPSTPLHPLLFEHGVHMLSGAVVTAVTPVLHLIQQGAVFRQVRHGGVRLVTMTAAS